MSKSIPPPMSRPPTSRPPPSGPVAFLGAGKMGIPMATQVARRGFQLQIWNRTHARAQSLVDLGAKQKSSPRDCVEGARIVVTVLRDADALFDVLERADGVLAGLEPGAVVVDMSTIGRAAALRAADLVQRAGGKFVDAPVSGSVGPAATGELIALVGGRLNDVTRAQPVLMAMCKRIIHAGDVGQGQALKVVLNGVGIHHLIAFASMLALGERAGLARRVVVDAVTSGAFASPSYLGKKEKILARDFSPEFALELALKDSVLNLELQQEVGLPLPVHREIVRAVQRACDELGLGAEDLFALEKYYKQ